MQDYQGLLGSLVLILDIWAIISIFTSTANASRKILWMAIIIILPVLGFIIWYLTGPRGARV